MMKKGSRVLMMDSEEARARFKHQALSQDYDELLVETEAKKRKLQKTIAKRLKLTAEVKFLRGKYKAFVKNPSQETPCRVKKSSRKKQSPSVQLSQPPKSINSELPLQVPLQDRSQRAKEVGTPSSSALFDLNKVSLPNAEEMEGIQAEWEPHKVDKLKSTHDLNLSIFKDVGSSSHVGKRKISWQDQVALRV
ncbi:uncharacterized protein A4U43_UnF6160 [Asparagus officinalis]|uniref:Uncharacterized protein n=1 Tax=Asparagus officinalis TaxID=4686 RepID=A0A1R3L6I7_ASPOF|nr:uncharacterized protein LOC109827648 [Asparagus officinalis]ONK55225.1 uncharacterized protein A4U43_UnF6160 [Asparagus officinalis]